MDIFSLIGNGLFYYLWKVIVAGKLLWTLLGHWFTIHIIGVSAFYPVVIKTFFILTLAVF